MANLGFLWIIYVNYSKLREFFLFFFNRPGGYVEWRLAGEQKVIAVCLLGWSVGVLICKISGGFRPSGRRIDGHVAAALQPWWRLVEDFHGS